MRIESSVKINKQIFTYNLLTYVINTNIYALNIFTGFQITASQQQFQQQLL